VGQVVVTGDDPYAPIRSLMASKQVQVHASEFHAVVNEVFHAFEAPVYDEVHRDMWRSLPLQFELLSNDFLGREPALEAPGLSLLDVGCGTGLATDLLLRSPLGRFITEVTLLDPSPEMLELAKHRSRGWEIGVQTEVGFLENLSEGATYDLVIACSVLHHIPDLVGFCRELTRIIPAGGHLLHIHDPNGESLGEDMEARASQLKSSLGPRSTKDRFRLSHIEGKLRSMFPWVRKRSYLDQVNKELRGRGLISSNLSREEIWRITDLRVYDDTGIRISDLRDLLSGFRLINHRSYGFFGRLWSDLPKALRPLEERMIEDGKKDGAFVAALWQRH
jgi:SAM-dependent methyltransferase